MINNRGYALAYRLCALVVAAWGVVSGSGFNGGLRRFLFYTGLSNVLVAAMFFVLCWATLRGLIRGGSGGSCCYFPRFCRLCALIIAYTLVIFWCVLAPMCFFRGISLFGCGNLVVHTVVPLLAIIDCRLFCERGRLRRRDVFLWPLVPLGYVIFCYCLSFFGVVFYSLDGVDYHYPYYFMDYDVLGFYSILFLLGVALSFVVSAYLVYRLDSKVILKKH